MKPSAFTFAIAISFVAASFLSAQDDPLQDPDLQQALKQARELQKGSTPKMSDLKKQADEIEAQQKEEEKKEKAALQEQLTAPGPVALPDWTPATPQFKANGSLARKLDNDEVRVTQSGTSPLTPKELGDAWEAAVGDKKINHTRNNISVNGDISVVVFLSSRDDPTQEVRMEASRAKSAKVTQVEISSPLPRPSESED
jgi:hypothetical protein